MNHILKGAAIGAFLVLPTAVSAQSDLPTVTIMGKTFYTYIAQKGESLFGIANRFGWDPEVLARTNPEVEAPIDNGTLLYYPAPKKSRARGSRDLAQASQGSSSAESADKSAQKSWQQSAQQSAQESAQKSGQQSAQESAQESGQEYLTIVDAEDLDVQLDPQHDTERDGIIFHVVQSGESLYGIARAYATTVEDLYKLNPGLSYGNPEPGETIRIRGGSINDSAVAKSMTENHVESLSDYRVRRGDTWAKIAEAKGVDVQVLKEANPGKTKLKRGDHISIPKVTTVEVKRMVVDIDPREQTEEGRRELYNEVHALDSKIYDADGNINPNAISVAIVLADPDSNRDMEFARGALMAVDNMKGESFATRLTVIDGSQPETDVTGALEGFAPKVIVTTADKALPPYLTQYAKDNSRYLINAFDVKSEDYLTNPYVVQYLAPTSYFNEEVADYLADTYAGYTLLVAGRMDGNDTMGQSIMQARIEDTDEMPQEVPIDEIATMALPEEDGRYLIYATPSGRDDVKSLLEKIRQLKDANPMADIRVVGRPNWITMADAQKEAFSSTGVLLPSRFYFNAEDYASKDFINGYRALFGHTPIKSYPVYSATAYDIMSYFMPNISRTGGDFNADFRDYATLQSPVSLQRINNWGGLVNPCVYIVEFNEYGAPKKVILDPENE